MNSTACAIALSIVSLALIDACAAHTALEPVGEGRLAPHVSLGGPLVAAFDTRIPIPYLTAGARYGQSDRLDLSATAHLFPLNYGVAGLDIGATWYPVSNDGVTPGIGIGPRLMALASLKSGVDERFRLYPMLGGSAAWKIPGGLLYTGLDLTFPFSTSDYDPDHPSILFSPFIGYRWNAGERWRLLAELKWQAANVRSDQVAADYSEIAGHGALAPLIAFEWVY